MKKLRSLFFLILIVFCAILFCSSCSNQQLPIPFSNEELPKIIVLTESDSSPISLLDTFNMSNKSQYHSIQDALDNLVQQYDQTHNTKILTQMCILINGAKENIKDSNSVIIAYYTRMLESLSKDNGYINKEEVLDMQQYAVDVSNALYSLKRAEDSMIFIDQYSSHLQDENDRIKFYLRAYMETFLQKPDAGKKYISEIYDKAKTLNLEYNKVNNMSKIGITALLVKCAQLQGDQQTADMYSARLQADMKQWLSASAVVDNIGSFVYPILFGNDYYNNRGLYYTANWLQEIAK